MKNYLSPTVKDVDGFKVPTGFSDAHFLSGQAYQAADSDTFICTFPKCGTTWMQHLVWLIRNDGEPITEDRKISVEIPFLEFLGAEAVQQTATPRFIKTHLTWERIPKNEKSKYIYVARNPFDCLVSFYYHTKGFPQYYEYEAGTFDDYFEFFLNGETDFGDYFDHVLPWYAQRDAPNVFFLTYESLQFSFREKLAELLHFLGGDYPNLLQNEALLQKIEEHSSFEKMSENQRRWTTAVRANGLPFIRKGIVGDWRNLFSEEQHGRLLEKLRGCGAGLAALWEEAIGR